MSSTGPQLVSSTLLATSARLTSLVDARPAALPGNDVEGASDADEGAEAQHEEELDETLLFHHNEEDVSTPREQALHLPLASGCFPVCKRRHEPGSCARGPRLTWEAHHGGAA